MSSRISEIFSVFHDLDGNPLQNGYVYIGTASQNPETQPIQVYWDDALTVTAAQPIRTTNGRLKKPDGSPGMIYAAVSDYSITVRDSRSRLVGAVGSAWGLQKQGDVLDDLNTLGAPTADGQFLVATGAGALAWESGGVAAASMGLNTALVTCTAGGTADAVTLTTGRSLSALTAGMWFAAEISSTNTGAMTVAIDGLTAVDVKTVTGVDTPADYIRTDVPTQFYYDGTNLIANREPEYGSNANGEYTRYANGAQTCMDSILSDNAAAVSWTYPKAFAATPVITVAARGSSGRSASYDNPGATACEFYAWLSDGTQTTTACHVTAQGQWY
jgi:hypothetical protein